MGDVCIYNINQGVKYTHTHTHIYAWENSICFLKEYKKNMPSHSYSKQQSILIQRKKEKNTYIFRYRKNSEPFSLSTKSLATYINAFVIYINVSIPQSISYNIILRNANTLFHIMQVVLSGVTRKAHKQDDSLFYLRGVDK